jgi:hypothetical protein
MKSAHIPFFVSFLRTAQKLFSLTTHQPVKRRKRATTPSRKHVPRKSDPQLVSLWQDLQKSYFPERTDLLDYTVSWSTRRQKRVLASVHIRRKIVSVAQELRREDTKQWLPAILYHEMCHAFLGEEVPREGGKRAWHGSAFKALVAKHPETEPMERWMRSGGWHHVVRSERARAAQRADKVSTRVKGVAR